MKIYLRPVKLEDGPYIVKWRNTPSVLAHCLNQVPISLESNESFYHSNIETGNYLQFIVEVEDKESSNNVCPILWPWHLTGSGHA